MADLKLRKGDTVLLAFTVIRPEPDGDGDIVLRGPRGETSWYQPEEIHSKVYVKPKEPVELGSRVADDDGNTYTRFTNQGDTPWVSESGGFWMWEELFRPRVLD